MNSDAVHRTPTRRRPRRRAPHRLREAEDRGGRGRRAEREANEEARNGLTAKKIRSKAEAAAFDQVFRDALEILREGEPEAAQRIVAIIRAGKDADALPYGRLGIHLRR